MATLISRPMPARVDELADDGADGEAEGGGAGEDPAHRGGHDHRAGQLPRQAPRIWALAIMLRSASHATEALEKTTKNTMTKESATLRAEAEAEGS